MERREIDVLEYLQAREAGLVRVGGNEPMGPEHSKAVMQIGSRVALVEKSYNPKTGERLPDNASIVSLGDLQRVLAHHQRMAEALEGLIADITAAAPSLDAAGGSVADPENTNR